MHLAQLVNYYPKYEYLDNAISMSGKEKINIFLDLKGCMQSLYQEWAVRYIINQSYGSTLDHSIFSSLLEFISWHRQYRKKRALDMNMYIFFEQGKSRYHKKVHKDYKENRERNFFGLDSDSIALFFNILDRNLEVITKVCSRIPNVFCTQLNFLEADFIPYYLQEYVLECSDACNIVYSADKDMLQCLQKENIFQFFKCAKNAKIISHDMVWKHFFKSDENIDASVSMFPIALAMIGDEGDGFSGPHKMVTTKTGKQRKSGIGPKGTERILPFIEKITGGADAIYDNIENGKTIFPEKTLDGVPSKDKNKIKLLYEQEDVLIRNIKLASYEMLSRYIKENYPEDRIKIRKKIESSVVDENKIKSGRILHAALDKAGLTPVIQEQTVYNLFL